MGRRGLGEAGLGVNMVVDAERWQPGPQPPQSLQQELPKESHRHRLSAHLAAPWDSAGLHCKLGMLSALRGCAGSAPGFEARLGEGGQPH